LPDILAKKMTPEIFLADGLGDKLWVQASLDCKKTKNEKRKKEKNQKMKIIIHKKK